MAVSHLGKKPGKFWYFRKRCAAVMKTFRHKDTKIDAQIFARDAGITATGIGASIALTSIPAVMALPMAGMVIGCATLATVVFFGGKTWLGLNSLNRSSAVYYAMKDAEEKWLAKKQRAPFFARLRAGISARIAALGAPFKRKAKAPSPAGVKPVQPTPVDAAAPLATPMADTFSAAATPVVDAQAEEERRVRAENRRARKASGTRLS